MNVNRLDTNIIYRSNDGRGPDNARIIRIADDKVVMERWGKFGRKKKGRRQFELPIKFFLSDSCGWVATDQKHRRS